MHSLAIAVVLGTIIMCSLANASEYYVVNGKQVTKVEALLTLAREPGAEVVRCIPQELSEKATLRNVKKKK